MSSAAVIRLEGVSFAYNGPQILENVDLSIAKRDFTAIVGPNGGGKTTLLRLILGLLDPDQGQVRVFDHPPREAWRRMGYMPQHANLDPQFPATVLDVVLMGRLGGPRHFGPFRRRDRQIAREKLALVGLEEFSNRSLADLSGGQRQRVLIARALACNPDLLLLDEPTSNLDMRMEHEFLELLQRLNQNLTIVLVSHDLGFVSSLVNHVICVNRKVAAHPTSEITGEVISELYGGNMRLVQHDQRCEAGGATCSNS